MTLGSNQDSERPGVYLLDPRPCRHRTESRRMIVRAAALAAGGTAAVLGAGLCEEIPLAHLLERFSRVAINDVSREHLERGLAAAELTPEARSRLDVHVADLTGIIDALVARVQNALAEARSPQTAIDQMAAIVDEAPRGACPIRGPHALVVASCVLSQLHIDVVHRCDAAFAARFPAAASALRDAHRWKTSVFGLARTMETQFVDDLARLTGPGGLVYLSESAQMCFVEPTTGGKWQSEGTWRMLRSTSLTDYFDARFEVVGRARWDWVVTPPGATDRMRWYDVQALVLRVDPRRAVTK